MRMKADTIRITSSLAGKILVILPYNPIYIEKLKGIKRHRWERI